MKTSHKGSESETPAVALRRRVTEMVRGKAYRIPENVEALSPEEVRQVLHELRVHQIELEMQNEELHRIQVELEASQARYFELYDRAPAGYFTLNGQGMILEINLTAATLLGAARGALVRQPLPLFILPEDQDIYYRHRKLLFETGAPQICELRLVKKDAAPFWVRIDATAAQDADGAPVCRATMIDINDRKRAEDALLIKTMLLEAQSETSIDGILAVDNEGHSILSNKRFGEIWKIPQHILDTKDDAKMLEYVLKKLKDPDEFGRKVAYLYEHHAEQSRDEIEFADGRCLDRYSSPLTSTDGQHLGRVWFFRDITERKRMEEALRESEKKYRTLIETTRDLIYTTDGKGFLTYVNPTLERTLGYSHDEWKGKTFGQIVAPEWIDLVRDVFKRAMQGESIPVYIVELIRKDRTKLSVEFNASTIYDTEGKPAGRYGIGRDITERKRAEEALKQSEEKYRDIFDMTVEGIYRTTPAGHFFFLNPAFARICGYASPGEMMENVTDIANQLYANPEDRLRFQKRIVAEGEVKGFEAQFKHPTKGLVWISINSKALRDEQGNIRYYDGTIEDITERKRAEAELQRTVENLRRAVQTTIRVMVSAVESRDPYTAGHQLRVAVLARAIAQEMGLPKEKIEGIRVAGSIHDIGKLSIPAEILSKPTILSKIELSLIKEHAQQGYEILRDVECPWPLAEIVYQHHERMDGSGYPRKLKGEEILMEARILAVADVVEAMASHRPYRPSLGLNTTLEEIESNKGKLYDAGAADACLRLFREKGFQLERT